MLHYIAKPQNLSEDERRIEVYDLGPFVAGFTESLAAIEEVVREPDNLEWFKNLWDDNARGSEDFLGLVQHICPEMSAKRWDEAWQWRTILHEDFDQAVLEFVNALFGWY